MNYITNKINLDEVRKYIQNHPNSKIYFGCDSQKISNKKRKKKIKQARFITVVVIYEKDNSKIFGELSIESIYDNDPKRPSLRLMNEVYKVSELVTKLSDVLEDRVYEIHLDVNPKVGTGSHCVFNQAVGYIRGVHGIDPIYKPDAFIASTVADHLVKHKDIGSIDV
jgi:predicted RNase H-related nuclease YkuK (DUF458 family)